MSKEFLTADKSYTYRREENAILIQEKQWILRHKETGIVWPGTLAETKKMCLAFAREAYALDAMPFPKKEYDILNVNVLIQIIEE